MFITLDIDLEKKVFFIIVQEYVVSRYVKDLFSLLNAMLREG